MRLKPYFINNGFPDVSGRIIMPLTNPYGKLVALTTRDIKEYSLRPHWHESFEKANFLYGLDIAKQEIIKKNAVIAVEGQFDVGYLRTIGLKHVVGILGTALSYRQASLLARYCKNVYLFFDGDEGGKKATERSMEMYQRQALGMPGVDMKFYPMDTPLNKDPDDFDISEVITLAKDARQRIAA